MVRCYGTFLESTFIPLCKGVGFDLKDGGGRNK